MNRSKRWLTVLLLTAALAPGLAIAQAKPVVVDGTVWLDSTVSERRAFLVGAANMISLEQAYAKRRGLAAPPAGEQATRAVQDMTLDQVERRLTQWYEANPGKRSLPVMSVLWNQIVAPRK
jgi:hypothetical protein